MSPLRFPPASTSHIWPSGSSLAKSRPDRLASAAPEEDFYMARTCDLCGKGVQHGQNVSHAHNVTKRRWEVNLQTVRAIISGRPKRIRVCTRCIRTGSVQKHMGAKATQRVRG